MEIRKGLQKGHQDRLERVERMGLPLPAEGQTIADWYRANAGHTPETRQRVISGRFTGDSFWKPLPHQVSPVPGERTTTPDFGQKDTIGGGESL